MNLTEAIKQRVNGNKYPTLFRIKAGKILMAIVALPIGTSWLFPIAAAMMIPIKPTLWAKDKINEVKLKWLLR